MDSMLVEDYHVFPEPVVCFDFFLRSFEALFWDLLDDLRSTIR